MGSGIPGIIWAIAILGLAWLGIAAAGVDRRGAPLPARRAGARGGAANATLLELSPARPLVVRTNDRSRPIRGCCATLGSRGDARTLADLVGDDSGIVADDLDALQSDIADAANVGRASRSQGPMRTARRGFDVRGGLGAGAGAARARCCCGFSTPASSEEERSRLALRLRQTEGALNSLTHLIEAAPFPMWYRGPDLKLGLVNSAFVQAVEGTRRRPTSSSAAPS